MGIDFSAVRYNKRAFFGILLAMVVGLLIIGVGVYQASAEMVKKVSCREQVNAIVVDEIETKRIVMTGTKRHRKSQELFEYEAIVQYEYDGKTYTESCRTVVDQEYHVPVGNSMKIFVNKNHPEKVYYPSPAEPFVAAIIALIGGFLFLGVGFIGFRKLFCY